MISLRQPRSLVLLFLVLAGGLLVSLALMQSYHFGIAHADATASVGSAIAGSGSATAAAPAAPDPIANPGDTLTTLQKLYHSGAWLPLAILLAYCILFVLDKKFSWFEQGKHAAYTAAALGVLALLAIPATQGTTPNLAMVVGALTAGIALVVNPVKKPAGT